MMFELSANTSGAAAAVRRPIVVSQIEAEFTDLLRARTEQRRPSRQADLPACAELTTRPTTAATQY